MPYAPIGEHRSLVKRVEQLEEINGNIIVRISKLEGKQDNCEKEVLSEEIKEGGEGFSKKSWENVDLDDYSLSIEIHKSMFFIDMLKDTYEFTLKGDEIEIFKKLKNSISEPITRKELIYFIQVEMVDDIHIQYDSEDEYPDKNDIHFPVYDIPKEERLQKFYELFNKIDSIHKAIDNMVYLEKFLNEKEESDEEEDEKEQVNLQNWTSATTRHLSLQQLEKQMTQLHRVVNRRRYPHEIPV